METRVIPINGKTKAPHADEQFTVGGVTYFTIDYSGFMEAANRRHFIIDEDGQERDLNFSPNVIMSPGDVQRMADMGWPPRNTVANGGFWTARDLELAWYRSDLGALGMRPSPEDQSRRDLIFFWLMVCACAIGAFYLVQFV